jgi:fumarylacetoacetase
MMALNETHDPALRSWVESANAPGTDFPVQNLPFGVFHRPGETGQRIGVAIGDYVLDLMDGASAGLLDALERRIIDACVSPTLNGFLHLGSGAASALRLRLSRLLRSGNSELRDRSELAGRMLVPMSAATMRVPVDVGDYTDFYASIHHATNVGSMFRPENPLLPNYKYVPIGYHGRASSIVVSGAPVPRPRGQIRPNPDAPPEYAPSRSLDYELEVGFFVGGAGNTLGATIPITAAGDHLFGACLVNDWSARDIQAWEYQPLGPFLAKSFSTTISPWIVTMEALAPFRAPAYRRPEGDPPPLAYLNAPEDQTNGGIALALEVYLRSARMREQGIDAARLSRSSLLSMYWTPAQLIAHHTSNGCNLRAGDLIATGTVSGPGEDERGSMLELTWRGAKPLRLPTGEERRFLEDGDEVILRGYCEREGHIRIGLGECRGVVMPAVQS